MVCIFDHVFHADHQLPDCLFFNKTEAQAIMADADYFAYMGESALKAYAFIGIFSVHSVNHFFDFIGIGPKQILFTDFSFLFVATYIEIPFMIMPIFNALEEMNPSLISASRDLGANSFETFRRVIFPLSLNGVKSGVQAVFIPSLSLFMLTRLIGGNRVITLGTAIEQHFLVTQNWGMGSTIGVILIIAMFIVMLLTGEKKKEVAHK